MKVVEAPAVNPVTAYFKMDQNQRPTYQSSGYYYTVSPNNEHFQDRLCVEQPYHPGMTDRPVVYIYSDEFQRRKDAETGLFAVLCATLFCCCLLPPVPHCH